MEQVGLSIRHEKYSRSVLGQAQTFASDAVAPDIVFAIDSGPFEISIVNYTGNSVAIAWEIRAEDNGKLPTYSRPNGPSLTLEPDQKGNFLLIASGSAGGSVLSSMRFVIVGVKLLTPPIVRTGTCYLRTFCIEVPVSGMKMTGDYDLEGGGATGTIGTGSISVGDLGNVVGNSFRVSYEDGGGGVDTTCGLLPLLDAAPGSPDDGGSAIFRSSSQTTLVPGTSATYRLTSFDSPELSWADPHPRTGQPATTKTGSHDFTEYVMAVSSDMPKSYAAYFQTSQPWSAVACSQSRTRVMATIRPTLPPNTTQIFKSRVIYDPPPLGVVNDNPQCNLPLVPPQTSDFMLGQLLGDTMAGACLIAYCRLPSSLPTGVEKVTVSIDSILHGVSDSGGTIALPYAPRGTSPHFGDRLAHSWDRARPPEGRRALFVLTYRKIGGLKNGDPVLVTTRQSDFETIERLLSAERGYATPDWSVETTLEQASKGSDHALMGYLYARIWHREASSQPARANRLFSKVIGSTAFVPEAWPEVAEDLVVPFGLLTVDERHETLRELKKFALQTEEYYVSFAGFRGLAQVATFAPASIFTPDLSTGISDAYRRMVRARGMPREFALEQALSLTVA